MAGMIGVVSGKFVLAATGLLVAARVNLHDAEAWINPSMTSSEISESLAARLDRGAPGDGVVKLGQPIVIRLGAAQFEVASLPIAAAPLPKGVDLVLGQDVLTRHTFDLDFRRGRIGLVLNADYRRATRGLAEIALAPNRNGTWSLPAEKAAQPAVAMVLDLAGAHAVTTAARPSAGPVVITIGRTRLTESDVAAPADPSAVIPGAATMAISLKAFAGRRIVLDLPHDRIWLDERPSAS